MNNGTHNSKSEDKNLKQFFTFNFQKTLIQRAQCFDNTFEENLLKYYKLFLSEFYIAKTKDVECSDRTKKAIEDFLQNGDSHNNPNGITIYFGYVLKCYQYWVSSKGEMAFEKMKDIMQVAKREDSFMHDTRYNRVIESEYNSEDNIFYRGRYSKNQLKKTDMFHIPFKEAYKIKNQRFSLTGLPVLYLANSPQTVAYELETENKESTFTDLYISQYKFCGDVDKKMLNLLDLRIQLLDGNNEKYGIYDITNKCDFKKFIERFILSCICSFPSMHRNDSFVEEYVIPQLVTQEVERSKKFDGICYNSSLNNEIGCVNFALFTERVSESGVDDRLRRRFEITNPVTAKDISLGYNSDFVDSKKCIESIAKYYDKLNQEIRQSAKEVYELHLKEQLDEEYGKLLEIYAE